MDFVKEFDTDILDLKIYFKRQKERTNLLYLSVTEYEFLHLRSEFVRAAEDFNARRNESMPESLVYKRTEPVDLSIDLPPSRCLVLIDIPERFPMDASDVACFLIICSQTELNFALLSRFHLIAMLIVTNYYQMDSVAALILRFYIKMTHITEDPLSLLCALWYIFGDNHPYCVNLASRMARALDVHPSRILELLRHRNDILMLATARFCKFVRDRLRAHRYFSAFRTFTCEECDADIRCKPTARYVYDTARCWPCCGCLIHKPCMLPLCRIRRCPYCNMAYFLAEPLWERQSAITRDKIRKYRDQNGIPRHVVLPSFTQLRTVFM